MAYFVFLLLFAVSFLSLHCILLYCNVVILCFWTRGLSFRRAPTLLCSRPSCPSYIPRHEGQQMALARYISGSASSSSVLLFLELLIHPVVLLLLKRRQLRGRPLSIIFGSYNIETWRVFAVLVPSEGGIAYSTSTSACTHTTKESSLLSLWALASVRVE